MMDYKTAGVNIDQGNQAVDLIKPIVKKTHSKHVFNALGGFAAGFSFPVKDYDEPILVSCTDGVGTKLRLAIESDIYDTVGIDLVAMSVNDLICMGAKPLFFLDYIACHEIIPEKMKDIVNGIAIGCKQANVSLVGGEMAEMSDMYQPKDFDLAGFCVGVVDKKKVIDGTKIKAGQHVYALPSSGIHSNGYTLVRKIMALPEFRESAIKISDCLAPTTIYVNQIEALIEQNTITGIAHITGGGIQENLVRICPEDCVISIEKNKIRTPQLFTTLQRIGNVAEDEMFRVFNMGVGMIVVSENEIDETDHLYKIGEVMQGKKGVIYG